MGSCVHTVDCRQAGDLNVQSGPLDSSVPLRFCSRWHWKIMTRLVFGIATGTPPNCIYTHSASSKKANETKPSDVTQFVNSEKFIIVHIFSPDLWNLEKAKKSKWNFKSETKTFFASPRISQRPSFGVEIANCSHTIIDLIARCWWCNRREKIWPNSLLSTIIICFISTSYSFSDDIFLLPWSLDVDNERRRFGGIWNNMSKHAPARHWNFPWQRLQFRLIQQINADVWWRHRRRSLLMIL